MISLLRNNLKSYKNMESKLYSNIIIQNTQLYGLKFNVAIKANFHSLFKKDNYNYNNRIFYETEKQNSLLKIKSFNFNFKNNVKLNESISIDKSI